MCSNHMMCYMENGPLCQVPTANSKISMCICSGFPLFVNTVYSIFLFRELVMEVLIRLRARAYLGLYDPQRAFFIYSRTLMARTPMARLPWLI